MEQKQEISCSDVYCCPGCTRMRVSPATITTDSISNMTIDCTCGYSQHVGGDGSIEENTYYGHRIGFTHEGFIRCADCELEAWDELPDAPRWAYNLSRFVKYKKTECRW